MILMIATNTTGDSTKGTASGQKTRKSDLCRRLFLVHEPPFDKLDGVISTISGYTGGTEKNPTYEQVSSGKTAHLEAIEVTYDPSKVSYSQLLDVFWKNIRSDPGQRSVRGYGGPIPNRHFYHNEEQRRLALESETVCRNPGSFGKPIVTEIRPAMEFYSAEDYHQDYYIEEPDSVQVLPAGVRTGPVP